MKIFYNIQAWYGVKIHIYLYSNIWVYKCKGKPCAPKPCRELVLLFKNSVNWSLRCCTFFSSPKEDITTATERLVSHDLPGSPFLFTADVRAPPAPNAHILSVPCFPWPQPHKVHVCHSPLPKDTAMSPSSEVPSHPPHPSPNCAPSLQQGTGLSLCSTLDQTVSKSFQPQSLWPNTVLFTGRRQLKMRISHVFQYPKLLLWYQDKPGWCRLKPEQKNCGAVHSFWHSWMKTGAWCTELEI